MATMILYPYVRDPKGIAVAFLISISGDRTLNGRSVLPLKPLVCTSIVHFAKSVPFFQRSSRASSLGCLLPEEMNPFDVSGTSDIVSWNLIQPFGSPFP